MLPQDCPSDGELLAWLQDPLDVERHQSLEAHVEVCTCCQYRLEQLDTTEAGDDLVADLRREPPPESLEAEPECALAASNAATVTHSPSVDSENAATPDGSDLAALTHRGHYEILGVLGRGGMGVVYKARNLKLNRLVAIKVLPDLKTKDAGTIARFEREMKAVARLTHPHVVAAYDADEADGKHFLVMEYVDGVDLKSLVKTQGPLNVAKAVRIILQAARGLHHAHHQGIIHRDVKPANLMLDRTGTVKILDMGLALSETRGGITSDLTESGVLMGTADYLAPEQAESSRDVDARVDVYSLGCSLYYLLTGRPLYEGDTIIQKVLAHREKPIPSLREACPECPVLLEQSFAKMVAKRPDDRQQTMAAAIADLEKILDSLEDTSLVATPVSQATVAARSPTGRGWLARKRTVLMVALAVLIVGIGVELFSPLGNRPRTEERAGVSPETKETTDVSPKKPDVLVPLARGTQPGQEWGGNALKMKFCWCPPGKFLMGCPQDEPGRTAYEGPSAEVVLTRGFWMGKCEVTQDEWERVMGTNPSRFQGDKRLPVENATWGDASKFCVVLTGQELARGAIPEGWELRLPTEAQWEHACRAGTTTPFSFGPSTEGISDHTWYGYNSDIRTHEVGRRKPNPWGLHDVHGNVWEWCRDWFHPTIRGGTDPEVTEVGTGRVMRGGGWNSGAEFCRSAFRSGQVPDEASHRLGFRVAIVEVAPNK